MRGFLAAAAIAALLVTLVPAPEASAGTDPGARQGPDKRLVEQLDPERISYHAETGWVRFVGGSASKPVRAAGSTSDPLAASRAFLATYGALFGLTDPGSELRARPAREPVDGLSVVRYDQVYEGIPILAGELAVQVDASGAVLAVSGEVSPDISLDTAPAITRAQAEAAAIAATAKANGVAAASLDAEPATLTVYDARLIGSPGLPVARLVWRTEVGTADGVSVHDFVIVDARTGGIALSFRDVETALQRRICDRANVKNSAACTGPYARVEGAPPTGNAEVDAAYDYLGDTYEFYASRFSRDSVDNAGLPLVASVRYCPGGGPCPWDNAAWIGDIDQMMFGAGNVQDDVAAHELTHGVTDFESQFLYIFQSGALSEMVSDVFGEFVDLVNGRGNDDASVRWLIGEDYAGGAGRNMANPPAYGQPDRMQSALYYSGSQDNFGVHVNSGVGNKAAFLMTDGGPFNGHVVGAIGLEKTAHIFYVATTTLLTSGSDYADLHDDLLQACTALIGTAGISSVDCYQVGEAVAATEMNLQPVTGAAAPDAPICPPGTTTVSLFADSFESGLGAWTLGTLHGSTNVWSVDGWELIPYATAGTHYLFGEDADVTSDSYVAMKSGIFLPAGQTYLRFAHFRNFELYQSAPADGGVVEYTVNGGSTWLDAGSLFVDNPYTGRIWSSYGNPLGGRMAFGGMTYGYTSSRLGLASLAGKTVSFRFRIGTDYETGLDGWLIDDVRIYSCAVLPGAPTGVQGSGADGSVVVAWNAPASDGGSPITGYTVTADPGGATCATTGARSCAVTGLTNGAFYTFTVTATNAVGTGPASAPSAAVAAAIPPVASIVPLPLWKAANSLPLQWSGVAGTAEVASYDVRYRRAPWNGSFGSYATWRAETPTTAGTFSASSGYTYCFSALARDTLGTRSAWTSETCTAVPLDDRSLTRSGSWTAGTGAAYYRSTYRRSSTAGAKLVRTGVVARRIGIVATTCSTCGSVRVYLGSTLLRTISLKSATTVNKKLITVTTFPTTRTGTLTIKVYSSGKKVIIDGLAISRN